MVCESVSRQEVTAELATWNIAAAFCNTLEKRQQIRIHPLLV
jgi:hypothetical protein